MLNKYYIPAFTMMDLLTGMVVVSIVIAMVFYLISATTSQQSTYQKTRVQLNEYLLMKADVSRQIEQCDVMETCSNGFCLSDTHEKIEYKISDKSLIRFKEQQVDTLYHSVAKLNYVFADTLSTKNGDELLLSGVELEAEFENQIIHCYFFKDYGCSQTINQKLIHGF